MLTIDKNQTKTYHPIYGLISEIGRLKQDVKERDSLLKECHLRVVSLEARIKWLNDLVKENKKLLSVIAKEHSPPVIIE